MLNKIQKRGISLYFALIILFVLMSIGLGVSLIIISQLKMIRKIGDSVIALYAADTGIEESLYKARKLNQFEESSGSIGDASYSVDYTKNGEMKWRSFGFFKGVKRAIEITHREVFDFYLAVYEDGKQIDGAYWCPSENIGPGTLELKSFKKSGTEDPSISFSYTPDPPEVDIFFNPPGCNYTDGCTSELTFSFNVSEDYFVTITFIGETEILTKTTDFNIWYDISPCTSPW